MHMENNDEKIVMGRVISPLQLSNSTVWHFVNVEVLDGELLLQIDQYKTFNPVQIQHFQFIDVMKLGGLK